MVIGGIECCRFNWIAAQAAFDRGFEIARGESAQHPLYILFLFAVGRQDEAIEMVRQRRHDDILRKLSTILFGYFTNNEFSLYFALGASRRGDHAYHWGARLLHSLITLSLGLPSADSVQAAGTLLVAPFPGLFIFALSLDMAITSDDRTQKSLEVSMRRELTDLEGDTIKGTASLPIQLALASMAMQQHTKAVDMLQRACDENHPLMALLNVLPLFDSLRDEPGFDALIARMNLPDSSRQL